MIAGRCRARPFGRRAESDPAKRFVEIVEREVGVPVRIVGVGAERDDYLLWHAESGGAG